MFYLLKPALVGILAVTAIYYLWVRKLQRSPGADRQGQAPAEPVPPDAVPAQPGG
jgi:hypothetical protein